MLNEEKIDIKTEIDTADFSVNLLQEMLTNNHVSVAQSALQQACDEVNAIETSLSPLDRIGLLLGKLKLKTIKAVLMPWSKFDRRQLPALVFFDNQWCRAYEFDDDKVYLVDAQNDKIEVLDSALSDAQVLWLKNQDIRDDDLFAIQGEVVTSKKLILKSMLRKKRWLVEVIVATVVVNLLAVMTSLFAMQVYDRVVPSFSYATLWALSVGMMIVVGMDWLLKFIRARLLDSVAKRVDQEVSQYLFEHLMRLRLDLRSKSLGTLAAQASSAESIRSFFSSTLVFALSDLPFAIMFIVFIAIIGGSIGWVYAGLLPIALFVGWFANKQLQRLAANELQRSNERQGLLVETIQGAEAIQSHGAAWRFADRWYELTKNIARYSQKNKQITSITTTTAASLGTFAYVVAIGVGVYEIEAGVLTIGGLIASTILGGRVIAPVSQSVQIMAQWQQVRESMSLVDQILQMEGVRQPDQSLLIMNQKPQTVSLNALRFSYPDVPVVRLSVPDLVFKAGDRVLLLGSVGSGKSTLLRVLAGIYKPSEGRIKLGHADLWELDPQVVVNYVAYLPQDVQLFKGSLKTNLGLSGATDDAILEVSSLLGVDRIAADNPKHMEMEIAEGGVGLSVGQRQLIGLGRVMLAKPTVWLLDEPTASLDSESETQVINALQKIIRPDDIVLIATHRTSLLRLANRVLIMKGGQIAMDTTPEALTKTNAKQSSINKKNSDGADTIMIKEDDDFHTKNYSLVLWVLVIGIVITIFWASRYKLDEVVRATGTVIASSRVQVIQSVDGGVLKHLAVKEGDKVEVGQVLATLDETRFAASVNEQDAKLSALKAQLARLKAEVQERRNISFPTELMGYQDITKGEVALFEQRRQALDEELKGLSVAVSLADEDAKLIRKLANSGDVSRSEVIRAERTLNEARAQLVNRKNKFFQDARAELAKVESELAQSQEVRVQRAHQLQETIFRAGVAGIVKNVRLTTVGGVLRAGDELMQIVPTDDQLIVEAKVIPSDIRGIRPNLDANIRFDAFDYTIFGVVSGKVKYVSADTLREEGQKGEVTYYRVHVVTMGNPVKSLTGKELDILSGMTAQIDIRTGERTVLDYLLKPLRKTMTEAFNER